jgi:hypothetical protein
MSQIPSPGKKVYRVSQIEGKISWKVEELWEGGVVRQPFGTKESAVKFEQEVAKKGGFLDALALQEFVGKEKPLEETFHKDPNGDWHCVQACAIDMEDKEIVFAEGMSFAKGAPFMGVDVAKWLDEHAKR